jgi:hypothetical protein
MQHRGRHRRRRRGRALRASLAGTALALTAAATLISTSQAAGCETPGALSTVSAAGELRELDLRETLNDRTALRTLAHDMGGGVGIDEVLGSANHAMRAGSDCFVTEKASLPAEPVASRAYCWEPGDAVDDTWVPRSVTTSRNNQVIVAGWTHTGAGSAAGTDDEGLTRVAFIDARDPANLRYRWVLLVVPDSAGQGPGPGERRTTGRLPVRVRPRSLRPGRCDRQRDDRQGRRRLVGPPLPVRAAGGRRVHPGGGRRL